MKMKVWQMVLALILIWCLCFWTMWSYYGYQVVRELHG